MNTFPVAEVRSVARSYRSGATIVPALRGVSLTITAGELVALAGPSGSGKSTLLHLIGCLDRPDAGEILFGDLRVHRSTLVNLGFVRESIEGGRFVITLKDAAASQVYASRAGARVLREKLGF